MYTVDEIAGLLEMHPRTIRRYIREGKLNGSKIGGEWRIREEDAESFAGGQVRKLHDKARHDIESFLADGRTEFEEKLQVCSIIDCRIDSKEAADISRHLIEFMNRDDPDRGRAKFQYYCLAEEKKSRFILWGNPSFVGRLLTEMGAIQENGGKTDVVDP